eukprot:TRINITY_DN153_c0_g1_i1.p1 TRINITY_DN153_c0_g1~~TRINITY_DN153_c0_g1_i1.p1  ORF type:complete len:687 (+),score=179.97 TRINITY_DN153_c0_g1_i1:82-2142(+)
MAAGDAAAAPVEVASPPREAVDPTSAADVAPPTAVRETKIRDFFRWRPLPWWFCFIAGIFLLTKFQLVYNDSPCAVLGTQSPVETSDVKRAFRTVSMCTHPDRLRGRLQRQPTPAELRRGETLFNRASLAKDALTQAIKGTRKKKVACYSGEMELAVWQFFSQVAVALSGLGIWDYWEMFRDFAWSMISFQSGFFNTICAGLWLGFMYRIIKQFLAYVWHLGLIKGLLAVVTTVVIGPLPTLINLLLLPVVRPLVFLESTLRGAPKEKGSEKQSAVAVAPQGGDDSASDGSAEKSAAPAPSTASMAVAKEGREIPRNIRQRVKKETDKDKEKKERELLNNSGQPPAALSDESGAKPMPEGALACVRWGHKEPVKARQLAATAAQFDLLLILTKPIIPLAMLLCTGQVWSGLISSLIVGHALRRWVPQMSFEAHHLLCSFFGIVHTLLGVSASQVEDYANREGANVLHLTWSWSHKDVLCIMHMAMLGSTVTAVSGLGNEPSFAASFGSGIALRIALAQDSVRNVGMMKLVGERLEMILKDLGVQIDAADEVVAYSGGGIGDCGGGPFRMLFGDGEMARWAAFGLKCWLMLLPLLATAHWFQRTVNAGRMLGKRWKTLRFVQRLVLFFLGVLQCGMIAATELNASNGALGNFWVAMLFGCVLESTMCIYDIRGMVRQIIFLGLFLFI